MAYVTLTAHQFHRPSNIGPTAIPTMRTRRTPQSYAQAITAAKQSARVKHQRAVQFSPENQRLEALIAEAKSYLRSHGS